VPSKKPRGKSPAASRVHMAEFARGVRAIALRRRAPGFVLGLDLGRANIGHAILTPQGGALYRATSQRRPLKKTATEAEKIERLLNIAKDVVADVKAFNIALVAIEDYAKAARFGAHQYGEIGGVVKTQLWLATRVVPEVYPPKLARKVVLGYGGNVPKSQIFQVVQEDLGVNVSNDHEADAWVVAMAHFLEVTGGIEHGRKAKARKKARKRKAEESQETLF